MLKSRTYNKVATLPAICGSAIAHDYFFGSGPKMFIPATTLMYGILGSEFATHTLSQTRIHTHTYTVCPYVCTHVHIHSVPICVHTHDPFLLCPHLDFAYFAFPLRKHYSQFWNLWFLLLLCIGNGLLIWVYLLESYARAACPIEVCL